MDEFEENKVNDPVIPEGPAGAAPGSADPDAEMKRSGKKNFKKGFRSGVLTMLGIVIITGICTYFVMRIKFPYFFTQKTVEVSGEVPDNSSIDTDAVASKLGLIQSILSKYYLYEEDGTAAAEGAYKGFMESIGDDYATYYSPSEYESFNEESKGEYSGIGAVIQADAEKNTMTIVQVMKGSPAEEAGVKVGDIIYSVGDVLASDYDMDYLVENYIRGPEGTDVTITFIRDGEPLDITITRRKIESLSVSYEVLEKGIGYISVSQFVENTYSQFAQALTDLQSQGVRNVVIDLRNNPGGVFDTAIAMADHILPEGELITYTADKNGKGNTFHSTDGHELNMNFVILLNENSASSSEVFAGALQDAGKAVIVGNTSFGKGIVQIILPLGDGSAVKFTTEHYFTPKGRDIQGLGIEPDVEVELSEDCRAFGDENDSQLNKALEILRNK